MRKLIPKGLNAFPKGIRSLDEYTDKLSSADQRSDHQESKREAKKRLDETNSEKVKQAQEKAKAYNDRQERSRLTVKVGDDGRPIITTEHDVNNNGAGLEITGPEKWWIEYNLSKPIFEGFGLAGKYGLSKFGGNHPLAHWSRNSLLGDNSLWNKLSVSNYQLLSSVPLEENMMYHTFDKPYGGFVKDGILLNRLVQPGTLINSNGKLVSARRYSSLPDRLWWDKTGHNYGDVVLATPEKGMTLDKADMPLRSGNFTKDYRITPPVNDSEVITYTQDFLGNYTPGVKGKIITNKMSLQEMLDSPIVVNSTTPHIKTSYAFWERPLSNITLAERLGIPKGDRDITHLPSWDVITPDGNGIKHLNVTGLAPRGQLYFDRVGKASGRVEQVNPEFDMLMLGRLLSTALGKPAINKVTSTPVSKKALLRSKDKVDFDKVDEIFKYILENPSAIVSKTTVGELPEETIKMINDSYLRYANLVPKELKNFSWNNLLKGTSYDDRNSILMDELANSLNIVYNVPFSYRRGAPEGFSVGNNLYYHQLFYNPETIGHEVNHAFRDLVGRYMFAKAPTKYGTAYGYFPKEANLLEKAYVFPKEITEYLENNPTSILKEKGALNYEIRALLSKENNGIIGEELNSVIDKLTIDDIKKKLSLINNIYSTSNIPISQQNLDYIKNALKIVGSTLPMYKRNKLD